MASFVESEGGDGGIGDGEGKHNGTEGRADEPSGDDGIDDDEDERIDVPDKFGFKGDEGVGEFVGLGGEGAGEVVGVEGHGLVDDGVEGKVGEVPATEGVERPVEPVENADEKEVIKKGGEEGEKKNAGVIIEVEIAGGEAADDVAGAAGEPDVGDEDIERNEEDEGEGADFVAHQGLPKIVDGAS